MRLSPAAPLLVVVGYAASENGTEGSKFLSVLAVGAAAVIAALLAGAALGFLFGLPKTMDPRSSLDAGKARLTTNTNLDQISDWLTKILVGLGLVQLGEITDALSDIGRSLAPGLGGGNGAQAFAVALLIYSSLDGFLIGYIWTRIDLSKRFREAAEDLDPFEEALTQPLKQVPPAP
jgi:hypothetical protein